jgi:hypothetical protein
MQSRRKVRYKETIVKTIMVENSLFVLIWQLLLAKNLIAVSMACPPSQQQPLQASFYKMIYTRPFLTQDHNKILYIYTHYLNADSQKFVKNLHFVDSSLKLFSLGVLSALFFLLNSQTFIF